MRPVVKICGNKTAGDARMCIKHGADIVGFVTEYPRPVPWNLSAREAAALIAGVAGRAKTCVVTGGQPGHVLRVALETSPDYIQLHSDETPAGAAAIAAGLKQRGISVIKALYPGMPGIEKTAAEFEAAGCRALLLDPRGPANAARGGSVDFALWRRIRAAVSCPVILAGGLNPDNIAEALKQTGAEYIDLMSGVESSPGVKDEKKLSALFRALYTA